MAKQKQSESLIGAALLQKVATLSKTQKAKARGYDTVSKGGGERVNWLPCLQSRLKAEGVALDKPAAERGRVGRQACYWIAVQANGNLLVGAASTEQMALQPGDAFELVLGRKQIQLKQLAPVAWLWKYSLPQLRESLGARSFEQTWLRAAIG